MQKNEYTSPKIINIKLIINEIENEVSLSDHNSWGGNCCH